jgi:hypothetical protein
MALTDILESLAGKHENENVGFGGYGTTVGDLGRAVPDHSHAEIIRELKRLHTLGRVYLQYWDLAVRHFLPWNLAGRDCVFNDFRLLRRRPDL